MLDININRYIHCNMNDLPEVYKKSSYHIALEKADINKDWIVFKKLYQLNPSFALRHLENTQIFFGYNFYKLTYEERESIIKH